MLIRSPADDPKVLLVSEQVVAAPVIVHVSIWSEAFSRTVKTTVSAPPGAVPR